LQLVASLLAHESRVLLIQNGQPLLKKETDTLKQNLPFTAEKTLTISKDENLDRMKKRLDCLLVLSSQIDKQKKEIQNKLLQLAQGYVPLIHQWMKTPILCPSQEAVTLISKLLCLETIKEQTDIAIVETQVQIEQFQQFTWAVSGQVFSLNQTLFIEALPLLKF